MILVTGASGFVGREVVAEAVRRGLSVRGVSRQPVPAIVGADLRIGPDLVTTGEWKALLEGVETIVHAAARVHIIRDGARDPLGEFRRVNVEGTMNLARQAAAAGVRRLVFLSSIKVNGEATLPGAPYRADSLPKPIDPYGISKCEAELQLSALGSTSGMEIVVIRPVLVYGPGVRANFLSMIRWVAKGVPLPLASIDNCRSLVALENLVDLVITCVAHPAAAAEVFLVSDGQDVSTPELLRSIAGHMGRRARLIHVPPSIVRFILASAGMGEVGRRLCQSLQVDITKTRELLQWAPPVSFETAIGRTVENFMRAQLAVGRDVTRPA